MPCTGSKGGSLTLPPLAPPFDPCAFTRPDARKAHSLISRARAAALRRHGLVLGATRQRKIFFCAVAAAARGRTSASVLRAALVGAARRRLESAKRNSRSVAAGATRPLHAQEITHLAPCVRGSTWLVALSVAMPFLPAKASRLFRKDALIRVFRKTLA